MSGERKVCPVLERGKGTIKLRRTNQDQIERTQTRVACVFTRLVCVSGDSELSEASPQSISINKSSVGG